PGDVCAQERHFGYRLGGAECNDGNEKASSKLRSLLFKSKGSHPGVQKSIRFASRGGEIRKEVCERETDRVLTCGLHFGQAGRNCATFISGGAACADRRDRRARRPRRRLDEADDRKQQALVRAYPAEG